MAFVIAKDGTRLMPTFNHKKIRRLVKTGKAIIYKHDPFTIQLTYETTKGTQDIELSMDTGSVHIGISLKSEKHEYVSAQYNNLENEKLCHDDRRKYRRSRRNRLRYRKRRFDNRRRGKGWLAPSIQHKADNHVNIINRYMSVCPVTSIVLEMGAFDTQALEAIQNGKPIPNGTDYQHGSRYGYDTLREAVFVRDGHKCIICNEGVDKGAILRIHHLGFWKGDHTDRLSGLASVCTKCHTPKNHQPEGKLWGLEPITKPMKDAALMNSIRWNVWNRIKAQYPGTKMHMAYGAGTKRERLSRRMAKSHANDAYCIGRFRPVHKAKEVHYSKRRRNNRILSKFYDARYIDIRDNKPHKAAELGCNRINRSGSRNSPLNERMYHGKKLSKGRTSVRRRHYPLQPGDLIMFEGRRYISRGCQHYGKCVSLGNKISVKVTKVTVLRKGGSWVKPA